MELLYGILAAVIGAIFWVLSFWERRKADPDQEIPLGTGPSREHRWPAHAYLIVGALLIGLSAPYLSDALGPGGFLLSVLAMLPYAILISWHNRRIKQRPSPITK